MPSERVAALFLKKTLGNNRNNADRNVFAVSLAGTTKGNGKGVGDHMFCTMVLLIATRHVQLRTTGRPEDLPRALRLSITSQHFCASCTRGPEAKCKRIHNVQSDKLLRKW